MVISDSNKSHKPQKKKQGDKKFSDPKATKQVMGV